MEVALAGDTEYNIVTWRCRALKRVETMGDLLDEVENVQHTLKQILGDHLHAVARTDSRSVYDHVHFERQVGEKRLLVELQALREAQKEKRMEIEWLTPSQKAWLREVLKTADINAMHEAARKPTTPWTHRRHKVSSEGKHTGLYGFPLE